MIRAMSYISGKQAFLDDFVPKLRHKITLTSADGSVQLPEYVPPVLTLTVTFKEEHRLRLDWAIKGNPQPEGQPAEDVSIAA